MTEFNFRLDNTVQTYKSLQLSVPVGSVVSCLFYYDCLIDESDVNIVFCLARKYFISYRDVTNVGEGLRKIRSCSALLLVEQGEILIVPHLL